MVYPYSFEYISIIVKALLIVNKEKKKFMIYFKIISKVVYVPKQKLGNKEDL